MRNNNSDRVIRRSIERARICERERRSTTTMNNKKCVYIETAAAATSNNNKRRRVNCLSSGEGMRGGEEKS
jgi:hypothetical protein